mgnify:FL=1
MSCTSCEERRKKIKAMYESSRQSISNAIAQLSGRNRKAEQPSDSAEQSADQSFDGAEQPDQRVIVNARRSRGSKQ